MKSYLERKSMTFHRECVRTGAAGHAVVSHMFRWNIVVNLGFSSESFFEVGGLFTCSGVDVK